MKKSTLIASALLFAGACFSAQAQEMFISGNFNNYDPDGQAEWALVVNEEDAEAGISVAKGTFEIPAGELQFNIVNGFGTLVPGVYNAEDEDVVAADSNATIVWDDDFYAGTVASMGAANTYWVDANWAGGKLEVVLDLDSNEILLSKVAEGEEYEPMDLYISGSFNDFAPEGLEIWSLGYEEGGIYRGTFDLPAGNLQFNITNGFVTFVPGEYNADDEDVVAATSSATIAWDNGFYAGTFAPTGTAKTYWEDANWAGGKLEVTLDFTSSEILLSIVSDEEEFEPQDLYIVGAFNDYTSEGLEIWQLGYIGDGVYRGEFLIPADQFDFWFEYAGFVTLQPGVEGEEEVEPANAKAEVSAIPYNGLFAASGSNFNYYAWNYAGWEGGVIEITVDMLNNTVIFDNATPGEEEDTAELYIAGMFNEYAPEGLEIWQLTRKGNGVYAGTFDIPADMFSFNIQFQSFSIVPAVDGEAAEANVSVSDTERFEGGATAHGHSEISWVNNGWEGGNVYVEVNLNKETITIIYGETLATGIEGINADKADVIYNLQGVRVNKENLTSGLYIINGKKVMIRK